MAAGALSVVLAYVLGAIPFGYLVVKLKRGHDVRTTGSGGTGATNVTRAAGPLAGLLTLVLDTGKGVAAVLAAERLGRGEPAWMAAAAVAAIVGHSYPVFLRFRGGKSVATALGAFSYFAPLAVGAALVVWLVVVALWRYVSLGSVLAVAAFPLLAFELYRPPLAITLAAAVGACIVILRHRSNLERLAKGIEPKLDWKRKS
jgi:glycerol-3-phosphate acyltransferase PlsY